MLIVQAHGPVMRVTIDREDVRNAFDDALIQRLHETFQTVTADTRAVVVTGRGEAFCAGGDLNWMRRAAGYTEEQNYEDALALARLFRSICDCPALVIARVNGAAFGGGCGLVAACDVAIAAASAMFAFSEVRLGLIPATISPFVVDKIGRGHARALFSTGEAFGAEHALRMGLVHEVVSEADLDDAVDRKLTSVLAAGPAAVAASKRLAQESPVGLEEAARRLARTRATDEGREGVAAFLEKRRASFSVKYPS